MKPEFGIVNRPPSRQGMNRGGTSEAVMAAIIATAKTGRAVLLPLNGVGIMTMQGRYRVRLRARGYRLRYRSSRDAGKPTMTCWAEPVKGETNETR